MKSDDVSKFESLYFYRTTFLGNLIYNEDTLHIPIYTKISAYLQKCCSTVPSGVARNSQWEVVWGLGAEASSPGGHWGRSPLPPEAMGSETNPQRWANFAIFFS